MIIGHAATSGGSRPRGTSPRYNATAPIEASSGGHSRHRLNLAGTAQLNHAIHVAAVTQLRNDTEGRTYYDRKPPRARTSKEAIRALKRQTLRPCLPARLVADARRVAV